MKYEIVELEDLSGNQTTIYSVIWGEDELTLLEKFIESNKSIYREEVEDVINRLENIGKNTGAREGFFKMDEGKPGDGVCALYDDPDAKLRLYCIRYGRVAVILGGGGPKSKNTRTWQDSNQLKNEAEKMIAISKDITERLQTGELMWSKDGYYLEGNLLISDDEE